VGQFREAPGVLPADARARIAPGVGGDVVDGVGRHLRGVDVELVIVPFVAVKFVANALVAGAIPYRDRF
jgi:hypothetical protein